MKVPARDEVLRVEFADRLFVVVGAVCRSSVVWSNVCRRAWRHGWHSTMSFDLDKDKDPFGTIPIPNSQVLRFGTGFIVSLAHGERSQRCNRCDLSMWTVLLDQW